MMMHKVLSLEVDGLQPADLVLAEQADDGVEQADPVDLAGLRVDIARRGVVDEGPDARRADERDRHRQEDEHLRVLLAGRAELVGQRRDEQAEDDRDRRDDEGPQQGVDQRALEVRVLGEQVDVVLEADRLGQVGVVERALDGLDRREDEEDGDRGHRRADEDIGLEALLPLRREHLDELVEQPEEDHRAEDAADDGDERVGEP